MNIFFIGPGRLNNIIGPGKAMNWFPTYTTTRRNNNVNGRYNNYYYYFLIGNAISLRVDRVFL